jgi:hypothetical protein
MTFLQAECFDFSICEYFVEGVESNFVSIISPDMIVVSFESLVGPLTSPYETKLTHEAHFIQSSHGLFLSSKPQKLETSTVSLN